MNGPIRSRYASCVPGSINPENRKGPLFGCTSFPSPDIDAVIRKQTERFVFESIKVDDLKRKVTGAVVRITSIDELLRVELPGKFVRIDRYANGVMFDRYALGVTVDCNSLHCDGPMLMKFG